MSRLIRSESLKLRTTNMWWLLLLGSLAPTALALLQNCVGAYYSLAPTFEAYLDKVGVEASSMSPDDLESMRRTYEEGNNLVFHASNIFTSGQLLGVLFVAVLGILLVTNEFQHQTATTTFLTTPHRSAVVTAKLVVAIAGAAVFWLVTTLINVGVGALFLNSQGFSPALGEWGVQRAILLNLAAYACWAVLGVGIGALIRSQIGATVTVTVAYLGGSIAGFAFFNLIHAYVFKEDWVLTAQVSIPSVAMSIMTSPTRLFDEAPPAWTGAAVLISYGVIAGLIGILIMRKRDIS